MRLLIATFISCASALAHGQVTYDDDGMLRVDGERVFVLGSYQAGSIHAPEKSKRESYDELHKAGFNVVHAGAQDLDAVAEAGLRAWVTVGTLDLDDRQASTDRLVNAVRAVKGHPAVVYLETMDEPAWAWMKAEARVAPEPFAEAYPIIKAEAPHLLLYMNHAPTNLVSTLQRYNAGTDIVACDIYPVNPGGLKHQYALFEDGHQGDLNNLTISQVGEYTDKMRRVAGEERPVFMVLQGFAWEMLAEEAQRREEKVLYPTLAQSRFMAYNAIIHGANGLHWWGTYYTPQPSQAWTELKAVVSELAAMKDVLVARNHEIDLTLEYHEIGHSVDDGVQWMAKLDDGALYVMTCNADRYPCRATISGFGDWTRCEVLTEDRDVALNDGTITDDWRRFDVHVYRFAR